MVVTTIEMPARSAASHVRPVSDPARDTLADAIARSATVAQLVDALNATDVIAFVDTRLDPAIPTAETMLMTKVAGARYVHVLLNPRLTRDERVEYLGHELQHVLEIAQDSFAVDSASVRRRFAAIGRELPAPNGRDRAYETDGARLVSLAVRRELAHPGAVSRSTVRAAIEPR
jgi:hypothetical protein